MTRIYKKPTHTNRYQNFNSAHSISQNQELLECLLERAQSQLNSKQENKTLETSKIMEALKKNDYPKWFLKSTVKSLKTKTNHRQQITGKLKHVLLCFVFQDTLKLYQKF